MKSIRLQILIYLMAGSITLFGLLFVLSNNKLEELPVHIEKQYTEISKARADEVSKELKGLSQPIKLISQAPVMKTMNLDLIKRILPDFLLIEKYRNLTVAYPDGAAWSTYPDDLDISHEEQYRAIFKENRKAHISQPFESKYIGQKDNPIITVSQSIKNDKGDTIGLVNGVVKIEFLNKIVRSMDFNGKGYSWIVNRDGFLVTHSEVEDVFGKNIKDRTLEENKDIDDILENEVKVTQYTNKMGEEILAFSTPIENSPGWTFVVSMYKNDIFQEINCIKNTILGAIGIGIILLIVFSFYYSNRLTKPILALKESFEKAADGNLNVRADESSSNELGQAAKSFNKMLDQIKDLTYNDVVTGIYNYNGFLLETSYKLDKELNKKDFGAIVIISIDDFKNVNSLHGFDFGDQILKKFATKLKGFIREDEVVARFLGDEFILFLQEKEKLLFEKRIKDLLDLSSGEIKVNGNRFVAKVSMGLSVHVLDELGVEKTIHEATVAKLKIKKNGGNGVEFYDESLEEEIIREEKIEAALYDAIKNDELSLLYQPIIGANTGDVTVMEALLRWNSPIYGRISPIKVIEIAERNGFILEIGEWVLREATRKNRELQERGYKPIKVAVNVSALQLEQMDFPKVVKGILDETRLDGKYLELEITETNIMDMVEEKIKTLKELKKMGISISVDDFGTGYSSLSYFTRFPIDILKIDKSFISNMLKDENSKTMVSTIISMAKSLKLKIIAEGVETEEEFEYLKEEGCDKIQGYLISKPVEIDEIRKMLNNRDS